jgi:hypothetical protein
MTLTETLAAILRGDAVAADVWRAIDAGAFCAAADQHGVLPLVAERWRADAGGPPAALAARARELARGYAAFDMAREVELRASLAALEKAGVRPVLFKGAHLAYSDYPRPDLRPRLDTDVLIPADAGARRAAHDALTALGYDTPPHVGGDLVMAQRPYVKRRDGRARHTIDVHWRVANPQLFARVLGHEELARNAVALPRLGPAARGPCGPHALMIACIHRVAHHGGSDCLIWLYDIDRVARRLSNDDWSRFLALATGRQVGEVCLVSLDRASARFATPIPDLVRAAMSPAAGAREPTARYLAPPGHGVRAALSDVRAMNSWRDRARVAAEHLLPPAEYMRATYAPGSRAPLAWLYVRRVVTALATAATGRP